jgi:hypothetical protein
LALIKEFVKVVFFVSSFIPLYVIFVILNIESILLDVFFIVIIALSSGLLYYVFSIVRHIDGQYKEFKEVENINRVNLEYFVVYIIPFLSINLLDIRIAISIFILFGMMCLMYVRSDIIYMNPLFTIGGLNLFRVKDDKGDQYILISRKKIHKQDGEEVKDLAHGVLVGS